MYHMFFSLFFIAGSAYDGRTGSAEIPGSPTMGVSRGTADLPSFHSLARTKKTRHKPAGELIFRLLGGNDFIYFFYFNVPLRFILFMNVDIENIRCIKKV